MHYYWYICSRGSFRIYYAIDKAGNVVHTAHLLPKMIRLSFMGPKDVQIGPAYTVPSARGRGIYPWVLTRIIADQLEGRARGEIRRILIFCSADNAASIAGILKAGFTRIGAVKKKGMLQSYKSVLSLDADRGE